MRRAAAIGLTTVIIALAAPAGAHERLLVPELPGWRVVSSHTDATADVSELIPGHETDESWTRRFTVQAYRNSPMTVAAFLDGLADRAAEACDGSAVEPINPVAVGIMEAGRRGVACCRYHGDGKGSYSLFYALRGRDALYVVAFAWRGTPFRPGTLPMALSELADWNSELDHVSLCDDSDPNLPCPR